MKLNEALFEAEDSEAIDNLSWEYVNPGMAFIDDYGKKWVFDNKFTDFFDEKIYWFSIWSAIDEEGNETYFIIDQSLDLKDDGFYKIADGPLNTFEEAQIIFGEIVDQIDVDNDAAFINPGVVVDKLDTDEYEESLHEDTPSNMKTFQLSYIVNNTKTTDTINALNMTDAEKLVKSKYSGQNIQFTQKKDITQQVKEDVDIGSLKDMVGTVEGDVVQSQMDLITKEDGPQPGPETGSAGMLIKAINDEWNTIDYYNTIIATISSELSGDDQESIIAIFKDIINEENNHVGMIQKALELISPNVAIIKDGEKEAEEKIDQVEVKQ